MSNRRNNSTRGRRKAHARRSHQPPKPRTTPLARSNPFRHDARRRAFDETIAVVTQLYPSASVDWVRRRAWAKARTVIVSAKKRVAK